MIQVTKNIEEANCITHGSIFHADEVFATVILSKIKDVIVFRTNKVPEEVNKNILIYDINGGKYDHHQINRKVRKNGVTYAACGLIWQDFGKQVLKDVYRCEDSILEVAFEKIDQNFIQFIDANDNGELPDFDTPYKIISISNIISSFNSLWDEDGNQDAKFLEATKMANIIFDNTIKGVLSKLKAKTKVEEQIEKSKDGIMILNQCLPWKEWLLSSSNEKAKDIFFVIYPSMREGYNINAVPKKLGSFENRKSFPTKWRGLSSKDLQDITKVKTASFCHNAGFLCVTDSLEDAIKIAKIVIKKEK